MKSHLTRRAMLAISGASAAVFTPLSPALAFGVDPLVTISGPAFGTRWAVTLPSGSDAQSLRPALTEMLAEIDRMMSPWRLDSEITAFNRAAAGTRAVSEETSRVAQAALAMARQSDGWFDPTVGPLVARFGFGPIDAPADEVAHWAQMEAAPGALTKTKPGQTLDLCGIAKGRALDLIADIVAAAGHEDFLIDLGGELLGRGHHPQGRPWQVAIEDPRIGVEGAAGALQLDNLAVATSGLAAQNYRIGPRLYSHIINPHLGTAVQNTTASVSVVAPDAMTADAWATALLAAGSDGPALATRAGVVALFLIAQPDGLHRITTADFDRYLL